MSESADQPSRPDTGTGGSTASSPSVQWLDVVGDPDVWRTFGLTVTDDGSIPLVGASLRLRPPPGSGTAPTASSPAGGGIVGWALSGIAPNEPVESLDGLPTDVVEPAPPVYADHPLGASGLDHVVVLTADLDRTSQAIASATGCELKRIREVGTMRQGFHRIGRGGLIVELVERPDVEPGPARFWGLVLIVDDLDAACGLIGTDRISPPKEAVQPGRRIATVRQGAGLGLPLALMSH